MKQRQEKKSSLRKFAFILLGIFLGGLASRIIIFFLAIQLPHIISHIINYSILASLLIYIGLQIYHKKVKHRLV